MDLKEGIQRRRGQRDLRVFIGLASHLDHHPEDRSWGEPQIVADATDLLGPAQTMRHLSPAGRATPC